MSVKAAQYMDMLTRFYSKHDTSKISGVSALVEFYITKGGETGQGDGVEQLNATLRETYGEDLTTKDLRFNFHVHDDPATAFHDTAVQEKAAREAAKSAALEQLRSGMSRLDTVVDEEEDARPKTTGRTFAQLQALRAARGQAIS